MDTRVEVCKLDARWASGLDARRESAGREWEITNRMRGDTYIRGVFLHLPKAGWGSAVKRREEEREVFRDLRERCRRHCW